MPDPDTSSDPLADLTFAIVPPEGMRLAHRMQMMLMFTSDGELKHLSPRDPFFVIGQSTGEADTDDLQAFARARLLQTDGYINFQIKRDRVVMVGGLQGFEIDADAVEARSEEPVAIYQLILGSPSDRTYFIAQGIVHRDLAAQHLPHFERSAHSFVPR